MDRVGVRLLRLGLRKGDRVAAVGHNSDAYLILFVACARAGLVHVPINYNSTGGELRYLLEQSGSAAVFADDSCRAAMDDVAAARAMGEVLDWAREGPVQRLDVDVVDEDLVQLLYTSGTTSLPKGAMMTHRAFVHEYMSCVVALDLDERDTPVHALPLYHSAQMHVFLMPYLAIGATNHLIVSAEPEDVLAAASAVGVTSFFAPPTVWIALAREPGFARAMGTLRKLYYGASIMPLPVLERLRRTLPSAGFYNIFGQSEAGPLTTVLHPDEHAERPGSVGLAVPFVEVRVVDGDMRDVAPGEQGEAVYRSPQLCEGYWDKPEDTAAAFGGGWFRSGDLVRRDVEGYLYVVDRVKDVINTGGVLVASREVEETLYTHPAVGEVAVIATPHERWLEAVTAVVVLTDDATEDELIAHARERLAPHKVPKLVHIVDELPCTSSGKLLKRELRRRFAGDPSAVQGHAVDVSAMLPNVR